MGVTLPQAAAPAANYLPAVGYGGFVFVSGQLPLEAGRLQVFGKVGAEVGLEDGRRAARLCAINVLAQVGAELGGDLERIIRLVRITGYVASAPSFTEQHLVMNGASDLFVEVLGERGRHARVAIGTAALPLDATAEVDAIFAVE